MILNQKRVIIKEGIFPNDLINKIKITKSCNWFFSDFTKSKRIETLLNQDFDSRVFVQK